MYHLLSCLRESSLVRDIEIIKLTLEEDIQRVHLKAPTCMTLADIDNYFPKAQQLGLDKN